MRAAGDAAGPWDPSHRLAAALVLARHRTAEFLLAVPIPRIGTAAGTVAAGRSHRSRSRSSASLRCKSGIGCEIRRHRHISDPLLPKCRARAAKHDSANPDPSQRSHGVLQSYPSPPGGLPRTPAGASRALVGGNLVHVTRGLVPRRPYWINLRPACVRRKHAFQMPAKQTQSLHFRNLLYPPTRQATEAEKPVQPCPPAGFVVQLADHPAVPIDPVRSPGFAGSIGLVGLTRLI